MGSLDLRDASTLLKNENDRSVGPYACMKTSCGHMWDKNVALLASCDQKCKCLRDRIELIAQDQNFVNDHNFCTRLPN